MEQRQRLQECQIAPLLCVALRQNGGTSGNDAARARHQRLQRLLLLVRQCGLTQQRLLLIRQGEGACGLIARVQDDVDTGRCDHGLGYIARMLQRQREKRQHEKNLREGKRKPWAPPPQPRNEEERRGASPPARSKKAQPKPKPPGQGGSAHFAKDGPVRPGRSPKPGPGGRRLSGKFRHNP